MSAELQRLWHQWRTAQAWESDPVHFAAKVAEEAGEVVGATLKLEQNGRAGTHPDYTVDHLAQEIGQLLGTVFCLAEHYGIDPIFEADVELARVRLRFPTPKPSDG